MENVKITKGYTPIYGIGYDIEVNGRRDWFVLEEDHYGEILSVEIPIEEKILEFLGISVDDAYDEDIMVELINKYGDEEAKNSINKHTDFKIKVHSTTADNCTVAYEFLKNNSPVDSMCLFLDSKNVWTYPHRKLWDLLELTEENHNDFGTLIGVVKKHGDAEALESIKDFIVEETTTNESLEYYKEVVQTETTLKDLVEKYGDRVLKQDVLDNLDDLFITYEIPNDYFDRAQGELEHEQQYWYFDYDSDTVDCAYWDKNCSNISWTRLRHRNVFLTEQGADKFKYTLKTRHALIDIVNTYNSRTGFKADFTDSGQEKFGILGIGYSINKIYTTTCFADSLGLFGLYVSSADEIDFIRDLFTFEQWEAMMHL